ncbi:MAG: hypothetical protein LBU50_05875 [Cellulomonas sp.]|nr:hypothetical protein [Cellulomonas sp.]
MKVLRIAAAPVVGLVVGVLAGALGSVAHWGHRPWGLVAGLLLVLASGTMMRAWAGRPALAALAVGLGAALVVLSQSGRGGEALIELSTAASPTGADPGVFGRVWVAGAVIALVLVAVAPAVLFSDRGFSDRLLSDRLLSDRSAVPQTHPAEPYEFDKAPDEGIEGDLSAGR